MKKNTTIMRVDLEFKQFTKRFAERNKITVPDATSIFEKELKNVKKRIRREDIEF